MSVKDFFAFLLERKDVQWDFSQKFCRMPMRSKQLIRIQWESRPESYGRNYFEEKKVEYNQKKDEQIEIISKQVGFIK